MFSELHELDELGFKLSDLLQVSPEHPFDTENVVDLLPDDICLGVSSLNPVLGVGVKPTQDIVGQQGCFLRDCQYRARPSRDRERQAGKIHTRDARQPVFVRWLTLRIEHIGNAHPLEIPIEPGAPDHGCDPPWRDQSIG